MKKTLILAAVFIAALIAPASAASDEWGSDIDREQLSKTCIRYQGGWMGAGPCWLLDQPAPEVTPVEPVITPTPVVTELPTSNSTPVSVGTSTPTSNQRQVAPKFEVGVVGNPKPKAPGKQDRPGTVAPDPPPVWTPPTPVRLPAPGECVVWIYTAGAWSGFGWCYDQGVQPPATTRPN